jgi:hypothetical protein
MQKIILSLCFVLLYITVKAQYIDESFEGSFPPTGWLVINNGSGNNWKQNNNSTYAHTGTKSAQYKFDNNNNADTWLFTKAVNMTAGDVVTWSFWEGVGNSSYSENLKFTVGTSQTVAGQTTVLIDLPGLNNTTYAEKSGAYTAPATGTYYFALNCYSTKNQWNLYVDDVLIDPVPPCPAPTGLTTSSVTDATATLSWTAPSPAPGNGYEYYYSTSNTPPGGAGTDASGTSVNISGLSPQTTYYWWVRSDCGLNYSSWVGPATFFTDPSNDDCAGAKAFPTIPNDGTCVTLNNQSTAGATNSGVNPTGACNSNLGDPDDDVWFKFVAPTTSVILTSTYVSGNSDVYWQVFSGTCNSSMPALLCTDTDAGGTISGLTIGSTYYIRLYSWVSGGNTVQNICLKTPPPCSLPTALAESDITSTQATLNWTENGQGTSWDIELIPSSGTFLGTPTVTGVSKPYIYIGLSPSTAYKWKVKANSCSNSYWSNEHTFTTLGPPPSNDEPSGAISITLGAGCSSPIYTNTNATKAAGEPLGYATANYATVWYSFVAPSSGGVRVSTDYNVGGTLFDSRVTIYSTTDVNDWTKFTALSCDEDGGSVMEFASIAYITELTPGTTYYIQLDQYDSNISSGTFCMAIDELTSAMLATGGCSVEGQGAVGENSNYTGWVNFLDQDGKLMMQCRNSSPGKRPSSYSGDYMYINSGPVRKDSGNKYYLDRNYALKNPNAGSYDLRLYFTGADQTALAAKDGDASTLSNLNVTDDPNVGCKAFPTGTNNNLLTQTASGSVNDVRWVQVTTTAFSGFFVNTGNTPLPVTLTDFTATATEQQMVQLNWKVIDEIDMKEYIVERSINGKDYTPIGILLATRNDKYKMLDSNPMSGANYYRLMMVGKDGTVNYSPIRQVILNANHDVALSPNPTTGAIYITGMESAKSMVQVVVYNEYGQSVWSGNIAGAALATKGIDLSQLNSGAYTIRLTSDDQINTIRFIKL